MPSFTLIAEKRSITYPLIGGIWLLVTLYAIAHDQYIVRIAPEHFTLYHAPIWNLSNPHLIAAAWAFKAAVLPGFLLGIASTAVARHGPWPKLSPRLVLTGTLAVIALTELISFSVGLWTSNTGSPLFPDSFYPSHKLPLLTTQSIQLSCYLAAAFFSTAWLITMAIMRFRNRLVPEDRFLTAPPIERPTCPKPLVTHRSPHHQRDSRR